MLEVLKAGLSSTVQDIRERHGVAEFGVNLGGALDHYSAAAANVLVGNDPTDAVIEAAYLPPTLLAHEPVTVAVTGATVDVTVNGQRHDTWTAFHVNAGETVELGPCRDAPRAYLAFSGGVDVPLVHGSRSTNLLGRLGGIGGGILKIGSTVQLGTPDGSTSNGRSLPEQWRLNARRTNSLRVVPVAIEDRLTHESSAAFFGADWVVTPASDRTGVRFSGPPLTWRSRPQPFGAGPDLSNVVDAAYPVGSIHVPGGAGPILLHRDGPTMGGYAVVAAIARADLDFAGQHMPQTQLRFQRTTRDEALEAWAVYCADLDALPDRCREGNR